MAYSIDPIQDNCYPGTTVLVNKLHIHDEAALQEAEALATYVNASKLEQCPLEGVFDFAHYKAIHQFLFSDLYDWAGQIRTVNLSKKGTDFCPAGEIEPQAKLIFDRLKEQNYFKGLPHDAFVEEITFRFIKQHRLSQQIQAALRAFHKWQSARGTPGGTPHAALPPSGADDPYWRESPVRR